MNKKLAKTTYLPAERGAKSRREVSVVVDFYVLITEVVKTLIKSPA